MYQHILLPTDGSEFSNKAIPQGIELAKSIGARVTGIHVSPTFHTFSTDPLVVTDRADEVIGSRAGPDVTRRVRDMRGA